MEGLDVGSVVFSYSIFLTLYFCFRSFSPARSHLHLTFWLQSGEEGSYHTGSHYLIISLSRRGEEIAGGDFFSTRCVKTVLLCFSSYFFFFTALAHFRDLQCTRLHSEAAQLKTYFLLPYFSLWAATLIGPIFPATNQSPVYNGS